MNYREEIIKMLDEINEESIINFMYRLLCSFRKKWGIRGKERYILTADKNSMNASIDQQAKRLSYLLRNEQIRLELNQHEMAIRLDMSDMQYKNLIYGNHGSQGCTMSTLNKIFENTRITCEDVFC